MIDPDYRLCPVRAISCTHHAHCVRAQLKPHATRQAWLTPNRRGDECQYFAPIEAYDLILAGSDAANTEQRTNAEAGGVSIPEREARAIGVTVGDVVHEPAGVPSASAGLHPEQREQLHAARIISGRQS